ncbi:unnamed protein product [Wuchereria bancrofti]|uniref:Uncharacterized protein n=1 Tax=Wuchereria bancrofti TaxID=6293 RepID=A0A3P7EVE0_WUCBA|nr:unnamed protein product [Wuchereria bancrofti]
MSAIEALFKDEFEIASDFSIHFNVRAVLLLSGASRMPSISHQNLQKRLLRYISRRKPCKYLLFIQFGILALLIGFFIPVMLLLDNSRKQLATMKAEHRIYQTYVGSIALTHCHYLYPQKSEELCDKQCGSSAYIVLRYENSLGNKIESTCPSLIQTVPCHQKPARCNQKLQLRQCPGVNGIHLLKNLSITPLTIFKVPLLNISTIKGEIVSALELFAVCPRCRIYSHSYKQLETVREGWPEQYRVCDSEILSENKICNPYDAL